jgi:hypothetical protein
VYYDQFLDFLKNGCALGGLRSCLLKDFECDDTKLQFHVLGLIGKVFSGPWMKVFYTSVENQVNHLECISLVRQALICVKGLISNPNDILTCSADCFGKPLCKDKDPILLCLQQEPIDKNKFEVLVKRSLEAVVKVVERQYKNYFEMNVTDDLIEKTASARSHNIDAEEMMGMFSAAQKRSPSATMCYISSRLRSQKNKVTDYLDKLSVEERNKVVKFSVKGARNIREKKKMRQKKVFNEIVKREVVKKGKKDMANLRKLEKNLRKLMLGPLESSLISPELLDELKDVILGKIVGRNVVHVLKLSKDGCKYKVAYWDQSGSYEDAEDYLMSKYSLGADFVMGYLILC